MRVGIIAVLLLALTACGRSAEEQYHYAPRAAGETPAVLQYRYAANPYQKNVFGGLSSKSAYGEEIVVCSVNGKPVGSMLGCGAKDSDAVMQSNSLYLTPGPNSVSYRASTKTLYGLHFSSVIDAKPGETYYTRMSPSPQISPGDEFRMYAGHMGFPTPVVQIFNSKGEVLQTVRFSQTNGVRTSCSPDKMNTKLFGPGGCSQRGTMDFSPVYTTSPLPASPLP